MRFVRLYQGLRSMSVRKRICAGILCLYLLVALLAPAIMPYEVTDFSHPVLAVPSRQYLLGTDEMGHDLFSLLINGFRTTVVLALSAGALSTALGVVLAFLACYYGKLVNEVLTTISNLFIIVPEMVVIMFVSVFAAPTTLNTILVIVLFSWPRVYKISYGRLKDCMDHNKVQYTLMMKGNIWDVIRKVMPDAWPVIQTFFVLQCNKSVMAETTMAFFGVGDPLSKTWGKLIRAAMNYEDLYYDNVFIWYLIPPILVVVVFVVSLALLATEED